MYLSSLGVDAGLMAAYPVSSSESPGLVEVIPDVVPGIWRGGIFTSGEGSWGVRSAEFHVFHESFNSVGIGLDELIDGQLEVSEDQALLVGDPCYTLGDGPGWDAWGVRAEGRCGFIDGSLWSETGFGDGEYELHVDTDSSGRVVHLWVVFIDPFDLEDEYGEYWDDDEDVWSGSDWDDD